MTKFQQIALFAARVILGWLFLYAGLTKLMDPKWTAQGYLMGAKTFAGFYHWLASGAMIGVVDALNAWGLTLIGLALILGIFVRFSAILGAAMMLLYYFPILQFPYPDAHSYIVDDHIVYAAVLLLFAAVHAGRTWGLDEWLVVRFPKLAKLS